MSVGRGANRAGRKRRKMFKSRLQELCQKKAWNLPEYNTTKQGQDHNPRFQATVIVNGKLFQSDVPARSSKEAQNDAARLAYSHFTSATVPVPGSSTATATFDGNNANQDTQANGPASICKDDERLKDVHHLYKNLLQNFAQKRDLGRPIYYCECQGPPHASRFRGRVTINEKNYEGLEFFPTIKEAEHDAARIALSCLSPGATEEEDSSLYKNLLQEFTQKEGCPLPVYTTNRSGEAHASTFFSIVEVKGEVFKGQEARTKKQAEVLAAKVAYLKLKECKSNSSMNITPAYEKREVPMLSAPHSPSNVNTDTQRNVKSKGSTLLNSSLTLGEIQQEDRVNGTFTNHHASVPFPQPEMTTDWQSGSSSSDVYVQPLLEDDLSRSNLPSNNSATTNSVEDSMEQPVATSGLSCNRVIVCPRAPNMKFPAGSTVLPFSDDNWVALKLGSQRNQ
ncbi:hypothetical protein DITRI_Ditri06bG0124900 [Diplodiscus trichospermus]